MDPDTQGRQEARSLLVQVGDGCESVLVVFWQPAQVGNKGVGVDDAGRRGSPVGQVPAPVLVVVVYVGGEVEDQGVIPLEFRFERLEQGLGLAAVVGAGCVLIHQGEDVLPGRLGAQDAETFRLGLIQFEVLQVVFLVEKRMVSEERITYKEHG